jgi:hypothetical protein
LANVYFLFLQEAPEIIPGIAIDRKTTPDLASLLAYCGVVVAVYNAGEARTLHRVSGQQGTADRAYLDMMKPSLYGGLGLGGEEVRGLG